MKQIGNGYFFGWQTIVLVTLIVCMATTASAITIDQTLGSVCVDDPELMASICEIGDAAADSSRERIIEAVITAADGSLCQTFRYDASVSLEYEQAAGYARLDDLNFDGYRDLCFVTAQGARNVFHIFALWNEENGCFDPIMETCPWIPQKNSFAEKSLPLEICCYELLPEARQIVSEVADGYRYRTITVYGWNGERVVCEDSVASVWDAGEGMVGERLEMFATQTSFCWLESYPESWYYEQEGIAEERLQSLKAVMIGDAFANPTYMRVRDCGRNDNWVNLRLQDSTESPSIATLDAGTAVIVLQAACGSENGWVRVWVDPQGEAGVHRLDVDDLNTGMTGYVWHSFLEEAQ